MKRTKLTAMLLAAALLVTTSIAGTVAYLTSKDNVKNTFTVGKVEITLEESKVGADGKIIKGEGAAKVDKNEYKLIPGSVYEKDPVVKVDAESEDCYLYVKEVKADQIIYTSNLVGNGWNVLKVDGATVPGVYYREVKKADSVKSFNLIKDNTIKVNPDLTAAGMEEAAAESIIFEAYAIQKANIASAAEGWEILNK